MTFEFPRLATRSKQKVELTLPVQSLY